MAYTIMNSSYNNRLSQMPEEIRYLLLSFLGSEKKYTLYKCIDNYHYIMNEEYNRRPIMNSVKKIKKSMALINSIPLINEHYRKLFKDNREDEFDEFMDDVQEIRGNINYNEERYNTYETTITIRKYIFNGELMNEFDLQDYIYCGQTEPEEDFYRYMNP